MNYDNLKYGSAHRMMRYKAKPGDWRGNRWVTPHGMGFNVSHAYNVTRSEDGRYIFADTNYLEHLRDVPKPSYIDHNGWFSDVWASETISGKVARVTHNRFIAYTVQSDADGIAIDSGIYDDEDDAWRAADHMAQRQAEDEKAYNAAWNAGVRYAENMDAINAARKDARSIAQASRENANATICAVLKGKIKDLRADISRLASENETLKNGDFYRGDVFLSFCPDKDTRSAFNDGAGAEILK